MKRSTRINHQPAATRRTRQRKLRTESATTSANPMPSSPLEDGIKYRALFDASSDAIFLETLDGRILDCNQSALKMYGYTKAEMLRLHVSDLVAPEMVEQLPAIITEHVTRGGVFIETVNRKKGGARFPCEVSTRLAPINGEQLIVAYVRDITERKQAQDELAMQQVRFQQLFENAPVAIALLDTQDRLVRVNRAFEATFQYRQDEIVGRPINDVIIPADRTAEATQLTDKVIHGIAVEKETVRQRKDGTLVPVHVFGAPIILQGKSIGIFAIYADLSERAQVETALRESEERYRLIAEMISDYACCVRVEPDHRIVWEWETKPFAEITGYTHEELRARGGAHGIIHPEDAPNVPYIDFTNPAPMVQEYRIVTKSGAVRWHRDYQKPVWDETQGRITRIYGVTQDITERKQAEWQLEQRTTDLALINAINAAINRGASLSEVTRFLAQETQRVFSSNGTHLFLLDKPTQRLVLTTLVTPPQVVRQIENLIRMPIPPIALPLQSASLYRQVIETKQPICSNDPAVIHDLILAFADSVPLPDAARPFLRRLVPAIHALLKIQSLIIVPLVSEGESIGIMDMSRSRPFTEDDLQRVEMIAAQLTGAILRTRAEDALRASADRYRDLVEHSPLMIITHDTQGQVLSANPATGALLGYAPEQIAGMNIRDVLAPDVRALLADYLSAVQRDGTAAGLMHVQTRRGEQRILEYHSTLRTEGVTAPIVRSEARDVTELKQAERALKRRADEFAALYETSRDLATQTNLDTLLQTIVARATALLGSQSGAIFLYDDTSDDLTLAVSKDFPLQRGLGLKLGEGMAGYVAQTQQPLILDDYSTWEHRIPQAEGIPFRAALDVPMLFQGKLIGVLDVSELGESTRRFSETDARLLSLFAAQAASAVYNARLLAQATRRADSLAALYALSRALADTETLDAVNRLIVERAVEIAGVTFARLMLLEDDWLVVRAAHPIRLIEQDLRAGVREPIANLPHCQRVMAQAEPIVLHADDTSIGATERRALFLNLAQSLCVVPLRVGTHVLGLLMLGEERQVEREPFYAEKLSLARSVGSQAASAIHRATLREQIESRLKQAQALHAIDMAINASLDLSVTLNVLLTQVTTQLRADAAAILMLNPHTQTLGFLAGHGFRTRAAEQMHARLGQGRAGRAALDRRIVIIPDLSQEPLRRAALLAGEEFCSYYGVPLVAKGNVKGVLEIFQRTPRYADPDWLDLLETLGTQAAIAIDNSEMFHNLQNTNLELSLAYDATIEGWSRALDLRDEETEGHTQRVVEMTLRLARQMNVREPDLIHFRRGALLHDIGKMGITDSILNKPGALTDAEMEMMRRHPTYAYELLVPIAYLRPALDIPYCHHERWDGTGYPRGLRGEEIPQAARIFAVADVWDALRSQRPYRAAWSAEQARTYIREQSGKQFDPQVVAAFLLLSAEL